MARVLTYRADDDGDEVLPPWTVEQCDAEIEKMRRVLTQVSRHSKGAVRDQIDALLERRFELTNRP